jgi:ABC-type lipoprotein release transport system permease subunit
MEQFLEPRDEKKGINKVFIIALLGAAVLIGIVILVMSFRPSLEDRMAQVLATAVHQGEPGFDELNKDVVISNDNTIESPMATGKISMFLHGKVHNKGTRNITVLEVNAAVVTQFNQVLRERRMLVVPQQVATLGPDETIPITLTLDGFDKSDDRANIRWRVTAVKEQ